MEAKELRIGNLTREKLNKTIYEITANGLLYLIACENEAKEIAIEPIPLTEEWLIKFGFFYSESLKMYLLKIQKEKWICWSKEKGLTMQDVSRILFEYKKIKYVHQLQNLYFATQLDELKPEQS